MRTNRSIENDLADRIKQLYLKQLALAYDSYLAAHSRLRSTIARHIDAFKLYEPFLGSGRVLDWGCRQGVDACLVRMKMGTAIEIHGCDFGDLDYKAFFEFAQLKYKKIEHPYTLPYSDEYFDFVIGSGVLEHVPNDYESIKEVYRILKPSGHFAITFLPNRLSVSELLVAALREPHHVRRYSLRFVKKMLLHTGFQTVKAGYHQVVPTLAGADRIAQKKVLRRPLEIAWSLNGFLEWMWPLNRLSSNLFVVARKMAQM